MKRTAIKGNAERPGLTVVNRGKNCRMTRTVLRKKRRLGSITKLEQVEAGDRDLVFHPINLSDPRQRVSNPCPHTHRRSILRARLIRHREK